MESLKSLMLFYHTVLSELGAERPVSTARDYKYIASRVEHEGLSFMTITLSNFGKDFEKSLATGSVDRSQFQGFPFTGRLPRLFGGFFDLVFDRNTGALLEAPDHACIRSIRQLTLMFGKIGVPCSDARVQQAKERYLECELEVRASDRRCSPALELDFKRVASRLWRNSLSELENSLYHSELRPKHGPGATADRLMGNQKYDQVEWTERLEKVFPFVENAFPSYGEYLDALPSVVFHEPGTERPVRVITVPKTLKTPRIIAIEPTCMQFMQQAIQERLKEIFRADDIARNLICYDSQIPNQEMARKGSLSGSLATLDLSEASDRVSNQHVRWMVERFPLVGEALDATRSRKADVDGKVIRLAKFASMGSALCFPMEAMVFATVVFLGIEKALNVQLTDELIKSFFGQVRIYGDDIIVPAEFAVSVKDSLEAFGFKVNSAKSFWTGRFRESCGREYYGGTDVSIVRVRTLFPNKRKDVKELVSTVSLRNQLYKAGYEGPVEHLDKIIEGLIPFPYVREESGVLGKLHFDGRFTVDKYDSDTQRPLVKGMVVSARLPKNSIDGYPALLKHFLKRGDEPFADGRHLERSGRPVAVDVKHRWASPI